MTGLTYEEAQARSRLLDVRGYRVELDVTGGDDVFGSVTVVRFGCRVPGAGSFVELEPARLRRAVLNGRDVDPAALTGNRLPLAGLRDDNELRVEADMPYSRTGAGLHRFTDAADGETYLALHGGLDNARRVFAAFDQPDLKAPITAAVAAPRNWTVIGNGLARRAGDGRWELAATPPISTYLFTLVAGPYVSIGTEHRGVPFGLHARQSLAGPLRRDAAEIFGITLACFDRYREIFAEPYPYDSYDQAFVPELEAGAMENPGCVTFRDDFLSPSAVTRAERQIRGIVIAHEMAHMWFGDLVTMRWWNDVWLSESFAEYMGFQVLADATAFTGTWTAFSLVRKTRGYDADQRASAHPVAPEPPEVPDADAARAGYDDISYAKGASALRQLVAWLGWPAFLAGINDYFARYRFGCATLADLLDCLSRASGTDVGRWAGSWLRSAGVDTLSVSRPEPPGRAGCISHAGGRPHRVWVGVYDEGPGGLTLRGRVPVLVPADATAVVLPVGQPGPALLLPNDGDFSYCKIRLDPVSRDTLASSLGRLADPLSRAVAWNGVRDLVRDGELAPRQYVALAACHLPAETDGSIAGHVIGYARWTVADSYLPPGLRGDALADLTSLCRDLLSAHPAGGAGEAGGASGAGGDDEMRLIAARGLIDSAAGPDDISALRSWLAAGRVPGGPDLDSRLRWQILLRLAVLGAASRAEVEHHADRDGTAAGQLSAARCRAALPDRDAKQAAWTAMQSGTLSGYELTAAAQGFWQADQAELLAGYVPRYFTELAGAAAAGAADLARAWCRHGFPHHAADAATVRAGEQCLETGVLGQGSGSLRRLLADQVEDLRRAAAVRAAF
ncbi:MAG TPA: aminopeptidase N [Streptosporangiaceae bacterium]